MCLKAVVFVIYSIYLLNVHARPHSKFTEDYSWRDYDGVIPPGALKAGIDKNGKPIYIGQTLSNAKLIPGKILENIHEIHYESFEEFVVNETIKILCTQYPEKFDWFKTRIDQVFDIKDKQLFEAGYEKGTNIYIGRVFSNGEMIIRKVSCSSSGCNKMITMKNGEWYHHEEFEILTYKKKVKQKSLTSAEKNSFLSYFFLVLGIAALIVLFIVLIRRYCLSYNSYNLSKS